MSIKNKPITLSFFVTPPHECAYGKDQQASTLFLTPEIKPQEGFYQLLIEKGFRRSGDHIYRPHCEGCKECISVRLNVNDFLPNKQQKRCGKKGKRFTQRVSPAIYDEAHYLLYEKYIETRHKDGDMYPPSVAQYKDFLFCDWMNTQYLDFIEPTTGKLIACCVFDELKTGLSAIYTFFDPEYSKFSPGRLAVLSLINKAKYDKLQYVYLGYWINSCQKMSYKGEYRPIECFSNQNWVVLR
ncbi:MAG: arginyl-tRNA--protein-N-Asp/Glu arginylyltransferase [Polaribacter sp.]|jgi:arginyl-tRNA--protein-N-Asp/Glu arginylyltransferase